MSFFEFDGRGRQSKNHNEKKQLSLLLLVCVTGETRPIPSTKRSGAPSPAALYLSFALAASLGGLIVPTAASLRQDAILLNLAVETLES